MHRQSLWHVYKCSRCARFIDIIFSAELQHVHLFNKKYVEKLVPDTGQAFVILEHCGGGDLVTYYRKPEFVKDEFERISRELLSAVCYLHERQCAHGNLKPSSVSK